MRFGRLMNNFFVVLLLATRASIAERKALQGLSQISVNGHAKRHIMGAFYDEIPEDVRTWVLEQKIFFVGSAPLSEKGHVNVSPRGHDSITIVDKNSCYYIDMTGSGNETISHLRENKRITLCWTGFQGPPRIVRFFGTGKTFEAGTPEFNALLPEGDERRLPGTRAIIWIDVHAVGTSCGYSVPFFQYEGERMVLQDWARAREEDEANGKVKTGMQAYWANKNWESIDGLPGLDIALRNREKGLGWMDETERAKMRLQRLPLGPTSPPLLDTVKEHVSKSLLVGVLVGVTGTVLAQFAMRWVQENAAV